MSICKRKRAPERAGTISIIDTTQIPTPDEMAIFQSMGLAYFNFGRKDKENGIEPLTLDEFVRVFSLRDWDRKRPEDIPDILVQAQFEQYIAGFTGESYHNLIFREVKV